MEIVCAHSPDSDDAFMFYGLATKKIRSRLVNIRHVLEDIESLNRKATEGLYEITAISYHAYPTWPINMSSCRPDPAWVMATAQLLSARGQ
jgi:predicted solute-binding protein